MRIVIAEDSALLREGLAQLLIAEGHQVVASVGSAPELIEAVRELQPDLALVDVRMPPDFTDDGIRAAVEIRSMWPQVAILVLSQYVERQRATELLMGEGGIGYLLKDRVAHVDEFLDAITRVGAGGAAIDKEVVRQLLTFSHATDPLSELTEREHEVLDLMAQGRTNSSICQALFITESSVEKHISSIFTKLKLTPGTNYNRRVLAILEYFKQE